MRRALIIGIDDYPTAPLYGCATDAHEIHARLATHEDGTRNFDCRLLTSPPTPVSRNVILDAVDGLLAPGADVALLYFSGHGATGDNDGYVVPQDWQDERDGVRMLDLLQAIDR